MPIALDHLTIPSNDRVAAAELLGALLGVPWAAASGAGPFSAVYVSDALTLDFDQADGAFPVLHQAFQVDDTAFDALVARLKARGIPFRSRPHGPDDGRVNTDHGGRIVYWSVPDGHVWEALTLSYARQPGMPVRPAAGAAPGAARPTPGCPVETPRLVLQPVRAGDLDDLLVVNGDAETTRFLPYAAWGGPDDARAWFDRIGGQVAAGDAVQLVVAEREGGRVIGALVLMRFDDPSRRAEVGYVLGRAHWGRGLMREALQAAVAWAFGPLGLRRLEAELDVRNVASARLLERVGFEREGLRRARWARRGELIDAAVYGLLAADVAAPATST